MSKNALMLVLTLTFVFTVPGKASAPALANPVLYLIGQELYESAGKQYVRYKFDVLNKDTYPDEMFAAAPNLPPCGSNTKSARTWVDLYDQSGRRLQGFCNLGKSSDLGTIWFGVTVSDVPPSWVYLELNDRKTGTKYKSNLADTTL